MIFGTCSGIAIKKPKVYRICGYLSTSNAWVPVPNGDEKEPICTQEEWDKFVQEMGMEKEVPVSFEYDSTITAAYNSASNW